MLGERVETVTSQTAVEAGDTKSVQPKSRATSRFTGEELRRKEPKLYAAIVRALESGLGIRYCARVFACSPHTIMAVGEANGLTPERMKRETASILRQFVRLSAERLLENVEEIPLGQLPVSMGIASDKASQLDGEPAAIVEHRSAAKVLDVNAILMTLVPEANRAEIGLGGNGSTSAPVPTLPGTTQEAKR